MRKRLYINNTLVDLFEDIPIPLNMSIADIRTPESRTSSYTKTIEVPGTKNNNKLFGFIFDVSTTVMNTSDNTNFLPDFNPNLKATCKIYDGTSLQIEGYAQLLQINLDGGAIKYEIAVFGELSDLFTAIGTAKLTDLDLSAYNHTLDVAKIEASWSASIGSGYVYPIIDYGNNATPKVQQVEQMRPAIYAKTYVDSIFSNAGFTYRSDSFFNSTLFKSLIIPYTGVDVVANSSDRSLLVYGDRASAYTIAFGTVYKFAHFSGAASFQYSTVTGIITIAAGYGGSYRLSGSWTFYSGDLPVAPTHIYEIGLYKNGTLIFTTTALQKGIIADIPFTTDIVTVSAGDTLQWKLIQADGGTYNTGYNISLYGICQINNESNFLIDSTIDINSTIPKEILQTDFLTSLTRMFNLYWDKTSLQNEVYVQTRDNFITDDILDYRQKIDLKQRIEILPMGELDANPYEWTYKADNDFYNDLYFKQYNRVYGDYRYFINNDFVRDTKKTEVVFSPTVLANEPDWETDMVLSSVKTYDANGTVINKGNNIRILYYGGLKTTSAGLSLQQPDSTTYLYSTYPYAGHLDDPYQSSFDLCYGTPQKIYFGDLNNPSIEYTSANLFQSFYSTFITEITSKDSKILRAYFRLRPSDIGDIDFSKLYYFKGQYFRLNRMIDHYIGVEGTTQLEFIKSKLRTQEAPPAAQGIGVMIVGSTNIVA